MRIGIYGGSFDPVHYGHVNVARTAVADLALDKLVVIPAAVSPFKTATPPGRAYDRLALVRAAFAAVFAVNVQCAVQFVLWPGAFSAPTTFNLDDKPVPPTVPRPRRSGCAAV